MSFSRSANLIAVVAVLILASTRADAGRIARMSFSVADAPVAVIDIRLFESATPRSVENFIGYADRYAGTFIHRNTRDIVFDAAGNAFPNPNNPGQDGAGGPGDQFVVQGGGFFFDEATNSAPSIVRDAPIADEPGGGVPGISNTRGTISFAKSGPDTVTSEWFVNLGNNSFLDDPNRPDGGFTAFGRLLGGGISFFDAIDFLEKRDLDGPFQSLFNDVPVVDFNDPLGSLIELASVEIIDVADGDYNFDGVVDASDYVVWRDTFGSTTIAEADGNGDGVVGLEDYQVWLNSFGSSGPALASDPSDAAVSVVPEPTSLFLATLTLAALGHRRVKKRASDEAKHMPA